VSNETPNIYTYWDNLQVTHIHGHLLQEEGYYPFGLEMKAISSTAAMKMQTRYKFNGGTMLETSFDVDYYETYFRQYDAQIGRFTGIDALSEKTMSLTTYGFASNNPINFNDPTGLMIDYNNTRGKLTNWNPQLRIFPEEYNSFWDDYWSDPFAADRAMMQAQNNFAFWDNVLNGDVFKNVPDGTQVNFKHDVSGNLIVYATYYHYQILSGEIGSNGVIGFNAPEYHGAFTNTGGDCYVFAGKVVDQYIDFKKTGHQDDATWVDYTVTSLELVGAGVETAVGALTSETGVGTVAAVDGGGRVVGTFSKLVDMIESGKKSEVPENGLGIAGNVIDQFTGNEGQMQTWLGTANDVGSMFFGKLSLPEGLEGLESADQILNGTWRLPGLVASYGLGEDGISLYDKWEK
jgi:RHS repeat-associated protein